MLKPLILLAFLVLALPTSGNQQVTDLFDKKQITCLAKAVYHESRGEPTAGQYAVAKTVINRTTNKNFPSTICGVVYQPYQFTGIQRLRVKDKKAFDKAMDVAYDVLNMQGKHKFKALYFHTRQVSPKWKRTRIAKIGNHIFYV